MGGARYPWAIDAFDSPDVSEFWQKIALSVGDIWWVDSSTGSDSNDGASKANPKATIDAAINVASADDTIFVMPGHAENVIAADGIDADVAGISIIGLGNGNRIPTVTFTAAAGSMTLGAANIVVKNIRFVANFATGTVTGLTVAAAADGLTLDGLQFRDTSATSEFLVHISVATTVTDLLIENCSFVTAAGTMSGSVVFAGSSTNTQFKDCVWYVDSSDSVIHHETTAAVNFQMAHCTIINIDTGAAGYCVELKTASTGIVHDCRFGYNKTDAEVSVGDAVWWIENYATNTLASSGLLDPAAVGAIP